MTRGTRGRDRTGSYQYQTCVEHLGWRCIPVDGEKQLLTVGRNLVLKMYHFVPQDSAHAEERRFFIVAGGVELIVHNLQTAFDQILDLDAVLGICSMQPSRVSVEHSIPGPETKQMLVGSWWNPPLL